MASFNKYIIDILAIRDNIVAIKNRTKSKYFCAVVKADCYGLGINNVIPYIDHIVDYYAVACFNEAIELRGITNKPILILNIISRSDLKKCIKNNLSISISTLEQLKSLSLIITTEKLKIHLAINSGMNRIGFSDINEFKTAIDFINNHKNKFILEGIFTHFYNADNTSDTNKQNGIFIQYLNELDKQNYLKDIIIHSSASLASLKYSKFNYDMIRAGIGMYGYLDLDFLSPSLQIESRIINITNVSKGASVGYGKKYVAKKNIRVATIPVGYYDGLLRNISNKGYVLINGVCCKIIGNICMDMFMCDISGVNAKIGDKVIVMSKDKNNEKVTCKYIANATNTIQYEVLTNIKRNRFDVKIINN